MSSELLTAVGIILNMIGVLLLFGFGTPFRILTGGDSVLTIGSETSKDRKIDRLFSILSWLGLVAVLVGNTLQVFALFCI